MNRLLMGIGVVLITTSVIESLYSGLKSADKKVIWIEKKGYLIRLKRGLYDYKQIPGKTFSVGVRSMYAIMYRLILLI